MTMFLDDATLKEVLDVMAEDIPLLFASFQQDAQQRLNTIAEAIAAGEPETLRKAAHGLKGGALGVGAVAYAEVCRQMENCGRDADLLAASGQLSELQQGLDEVMFALEQWCHAQGITGV